MFLHPFIYFYYDDNKRHCLITKLAIRQYLFIYKTTITIFRK